MIKKTSPKAIKNNPLKTITAVFGGLGVLIAVLGVVFVSNNAAQETTSTATQAYSGYTSPARTNNPQPAGNAPRPAGTSSTGTSSQGASSKTTGTPSQGARNTYSPGPGATVPFTGDSVPFVGDSIPNTGMPVATNPGTYSPSTSGGTGTPSSGGSSGSSNGSNNGGSSSNGGSSNSNNDRQPVAYTPMQCAEYELLNVIFRGNIGYVRGVPLDASGKEQWSKASAFREILNLNSNPGWMPGDGTVQAYHAVINPRTSQFTQYLVRNNRYYVKTISTNKGMIDWNAEANTAWQEQSTVGAASGAPTPAGVTAYGNYVIVTGGTEKTVLFTEYLKKDGKSYTNDTFTQTFNGANQLVSTANGEFRMITDLRANPTALPGSEKGDIIAQGDYVDPFSKVLHQDYFRGDTRYKRDVPIENGKPNFNKVSNDDLKAVQNVSALPGSGELNAMANYVVCKSL